ncbi:MAG TPA: 4-hydroxy-tetrahydrodipicolinate reductase [Gammaproteobacteria bacterium]|jgi:4-hydroxy-tetrahydrodipicolinate reductase|nr:4-hydroxy-tetrahydrodipicolinate reductase [Gammaproteobacteria bacterium]
MTIPILVNGAFGRMGQMTTKALAEDGAFEVVGQTGREYDLKKAIHDSKAQVVVDFTHPTAVYANTTTIIEAGARPVIGTSGLSHSQITSLQKRCTELKHGGIIAPNFSLGAVLMMKYAKEIAKYMPNVEIIEMHHDGKADSPSGTAMRSVELLAESGSKLNPYATDSHENLPGARGALYHGVPIHAVRLPGLLAHEQIIFGSLGETLTLRHDSIDRQCFMAGIRLACKKVMALHELVYGLEGVL